MNRIAPLIDAPSATWQDLAACRDVDPSLFFPPGVTGSAGEQTARARAICADCRVKGECLEYAFEWNLQAGVWGGVPEDDRRKLRKNWLAERRRR